MALACRKLGAMSFIRVYLDPEQARHVDVPDGAAMTISDDGVLEVADDMDVVLGLFQTWDHAVLVGPSTSHYVLAADAEDPEDEDEDLEDDDLEDLLAEDEEDEAAS